MQLIIAKTRRLTDFFEQPCSTQSDHSVVDGKPVERFLTFHQMTSHKAEAIATTLLEYLERETIDFQDSRGQSYDNASNMSRKYSGMQARLKEVNPLA